MTATVFDVPGVPAGQGSMKTYGRGVLVHDSSRTQPWRDRVAWAARAVHQGAPWDGPLVVTLCFRLPRPQSAPKRRVLPDRKPDVDKLARAVLDALTGIVWTDDARVCRLVATKTYDPTPGLSVHVAPLGLEP